MMNNAGYYILRFWTQKDHSNRPVIRGVIITAPDDAAAKALGDRYINSQSRGGQLGVFVSLTPYNA